MNIQDASVKFGIPDSRIYQLVKQGYLSVVQSKGRTKWMLSDEAVKLLPVMKKHIVEGLSPKESFKEAAHELNIDTGKREIKRMLNYGNEFFSELRKKEAPNLYEVKPYVKRFSKQNKKARLGIDGIEVGYRDHVVILVSSDFGEYRKIFSKITKAGEESGEHIWYFLSENVKDSLYENFDANRTKIFNWEEYEFFLKETKRFNADILVPVLQNEILSYIEKGEDRFRLVFETSSKVMNYVENFEDFFIYEKNFESAISKIPINILHVCSYVENDIISFKSKMKTIEFLKEIIHSHDKLIYLSRKGRVFLDMEAVFYLFEENFSDLRN